MKSKILISQKSQRVEENRTWNRRNKINKKEEPLSEVLIQTMI